MNPERRRIIVTVKPDGHLEARTEGIHGEECVDKIAALEALLDAVTVNSQFTDDYRSLGDRHRLTADAVADDEVRNES
jgi:hypothetical protein